MTSRVIAKRLSDLPTYGLGYNTGALLYSEDGSNYQIPMTNFLTASKSFDVGFTITSIKEEIVYGGQRLVWTGAYPKTVPSGSTPDTTGGIGSGAWAYSNDSVLRENLRSSDGLQYIGQCSTIDTLRAIAFSTVNQQIFVAEHTSGMGLGGGIFYCHSLTNDASLVDDNGFQIVTASGQVLRRKDRSILSAEMFGYIADFDTTAQTGTDNGPALRNAIKSAIFFGFQEVHLPGGAAMIDVTSEDVNLGGQGYSGAAGVKLAGQGMQSTRVYFRGVSGSVGFSNIGGSGTNSQKSLHGMTIRPTTDSTRLIHLYLIQGACFSHNSELYIVNGLSGVNLGIGS